MKKYKGFLLLLESKREIQLRNNKGGLTYDDLLIQYVEMFDNNKSNLSINQISKIKSVDEMKVILNEVRDFNNAEDTFGEDIWVLVNSYEWFIFKAYSYDASELANNTSRVSNWCTTYDEAHWKSYLGPDGALTYICNKLNEKLDVAIEASGDIVKVWDWEDNNTVSSDTYTEIIDDVWSEHEEPYNILSQNMKRLEDEIPVIDFDLARENASDEIMSWQYSKYNDLDAYNNYVWKHIDDDSFLSDVRDGEYERFNSDWEYEYNLLDFFIEVLRKNYTDEIEKIFIKIMKETNEDNEDEKFETENVDIDDVEYYIEETHTDEDIPELIREFNFEDDIVELCVDRLMDNYSDAEDYVDSIYGRIDSLDSINYIKEYIKWEELAKDIVEDMDDEQLRTYL